MRDLPGSPAVKISSSKAGGVSLIPGQAAKIPHASKPKNQNLNNRSHIVTIFVNSTKNFKMAHIKRKILKKKKETPILIKEPNNPQYKK